ERLVTAGGVVVAEGVPDQRLGAGGGVGAAGVVLGERAEADGRVVDAIVAVERGAADGGVGKAAGIERQRVVGESSVARVRGTRRYCLAEAGAERVGPPGGVAVAIGNSWVEHLPPTRGVGQQEDEAHSDRDETSDRVHRTPPCAGE